MSAIGIGQPVAVLDRYRERRNVRRAAAYAVALLTVAGVLSELGRARDLLEGGIRLAAAMLPPDGDQEDDPDVERDR